MNVSFFRRGLAAVTILMTVAGANAQGRPSTIGMTCLQAGSLVARAGGVVLGTGGYTYDRFVANRSFCQPTEVTQRAFVPTRETPSCFVGYRCIEPSRDDFFD